MENLEDVIREKLSPENRRPFSVRTMVFEIEYRRNAKITSVDENSLLVSRDGFREIFPILTLPTIHLREAESL